MALKRVLVMIKPRFLGDTVVATPVLQTLVSQGIKTTITLRPHIADLLSHDYPDVKVIETTASNALPELAREAKRLRAHGFDAVLLINRSFRSALLCSMAKIPIRSGHATEGRGLLLTHRVRINDSQSEWHSYADLAAAIGLPPAEPKRIFRRTN
jgi:heptosyltransferase-2